MKIPVHFNKYEHTHCCVYGCNSKINYNANNELSFHNLPFGRSKALIKKWVELIKLPTRITSSLLVCSRHFLPEDYGKIGETKILKPDSIPSQNLPSVWRNKFIPRTYGRLIKLIEVRGIGRLRLCFEAKLSRRLITSQRKRIKQSNRTRNLTTSVEKIVEEKTIERTSEPSSESRSPIKTSELVLEGEKIIQISDDTTNTKQVEEHCLTSEIEIKDEPLSDAEEEEETVEEMLAKLNEESQDDRHVTIIENDNSSDIEENLIMSSSCQICGEDCDGFHEELKFECFPCGKSFKTSRQLNAHNLSHFEYRRRGHVTDKEAICKVCNKVVPTKSFSLNDHMLSHAKDFQLYTCMLCDKPFRNKPTFIMHINSHSLHPHKCKLCGETFKDIENLDEHVKFHKVLTRQYTCRGCGQHFSTKKSCWEHFNSHLRAKSVSGLTCDVCGRILSTKATLKEHMFIHSGEKPFECQLCGKKIRHRANFIIHVQGHSLGQPHLCSICGLGFPKKSELFSHTVAEHPEDLPYLCIICGARFRTESRFYKHAVSHDAQLEDEIITVKVLN